jgi:heptosyltransferase-2
MPEVSDVIELPFAHGRLDWGARRRLGVSMRGTYERAYVLPNSLKSALIPWFARIPLRIGYAGEARFGLLNRRLPDPGGRPPMVAHYSALAGAPGVAGERPRLRFDPAVVQAAARAQGVEPGGYWLFAPGAEYGPAKCWPPDRYAALARSLHARDGLPVLLLGSGKEAALCDQIVAAAPEACRSLAGRTQLLDAMALIAGARGMASNDSGLMHVAAAFGIPQAAVFGSTSPEHTPPLNPNARVLWLKDELGLTCAPCFDRVCRFGHTRCLTEVPPERVEAALRQAVDQSVSLPT